MDNHQMMLFHLTQQMTEKIAVSIANIYKLPASTVDEIERRNPGMVLVRALEQRLIICKDVSKLREFHGTLKAMKYYDLAQIIEDCYVELQEVQNPPPQNVNQPTSRTPAGETTDGGNVVMSPLSPQGTNAQGANTPRSPPAQNVHQTTSRTPAGETTVRGNVVMPPLSMQAQSSSAKPGKTRAKPGETTASGGVVMEPSDN